METDKYQYCPLSGSRQIRLLKLHPRLESDGSQLSVDLITVPLDEAPPFEALSYAWGDPLPQAEIRCSGLTAEIGLSLHGALCQLAPHAPEHDRLIWADALCINQEDIPERNAQVRIMGDIYATASKTLIWLGEEDEYVARSMEWLGQFLKVIETFGCPEGSANSWEDLRSKFIQDNFSNADLALQRAFGDLPSRIKAYEDIWMLLRRPWFTRKWVIQEVANSMRHKIVLVAGSNSVAWTAFRTFFLVVMASVGTIALFRECCTWRHETSPAGVPEAGSAILRAAALSLSLNQDAPVLLQVAQTINFLCTDPRDHVFALLGISKNNSAYEDLIDYDSPIAVVSHRLARASLNDPEDLQVLWSFGSVLSANQRLSIYSVSWKPNFEKLLGMHPASAGTCDVSWGASKIANASGSTRLDVSLSGEQLSVMGRICDRLEQVGMDTSEWFEANWGSPSTTLAGALQEDSAISRWLEDCHAISELVNTDEKSFLHALLISDSSLEAASLQEDSGHKSLAMKAFPEYRRYLKAVISDMDETRIAEIQAQFPQITRESVSLLHGPIFRMLYRRFCRTSHGRLGWAPRSVEAGDLICVFDGMALPYAVRPKRNVEGVYQLVGECFISGLMGGQAMGTAGVQSTAIKLE